MDPGNKDSKTAVEFSCKLTKKREIGLRLKELVKIVENILKGTINNDIIIYIYLSYFNNDVMWILWPKINAGEMAACSSFAVVFFSSFLVFLPFAAPLSASPGLLSDSYSQIAQKFGVPFPVPVIPSLSLNVSVQCNYSLHNLFSNPTLLEYCKYD